MTCDSQSLVSVEHHKVVATVTKQIEVVDKLLRCLGTEILVDIENEMKSCQQCKLGAIRNNIVFGVGNSQARVIFFGEGPGVDEDMHAEPFVGDVGKMLNRIIAAMGLKREEVYLSNIVKCPLPGRPLESDEIAACSPFLLRQIAAIKPEVIVALGTTASQALLHTKVPISKLRSKFHNFHGIPLMPTYHPSYLICKGIPADKLWECWDDMAQVLQQLKLPVPIKNRLVV